MLSLLAVWLLSACVPPALTSPVATLSSPPLTPLVPAVTAPAAQPTLDRPQRAAVERAIADLAARLNVEVHEITVDAVTSIEITIPDTACEPEHSLQPSIPAQVVGQEIILAVRNQTYIYHARGADVMLCNVRSK
jgi:hypothetical protein